jgi:hypothetical protein
MKMPNRDLSKKTQLRRLRDKILQKYPIGKLAVDLIQRETPAFGKVMLENEEARKLAAALLRPWLSKSDNREIVNSVIDTSTVKNFSQLSRLLANKIPRLSRPISFLSKSVQAAEGKKVSALLRSSVRAGAGMRKHAEH